MKKIPLRNKDGEVVDWALVDDEVYEMVSAYRWHKTHYGYACKSKTKLHESMWMHRFIYERVNGPIKLDHLDHIDRNRLNNQLSNLREATTLQNNLNKTRGYSPTGYIGVTVDDRYEGRMRFAARISINDKPKTIAYLDSARDAAIARDIYVQDLYPGELIEINVPEATKEEIERVRAKIYSAKQRKGAMSQYVGVRYDKRRGTWNATIKIDYKAHYIGRFPDEASAARAYDKYCVENGLNRKLNFSSNLPNQNV